MALPIAPHRCQCRCSWRRRLSAADVSLSLSLSLRLPVGLLFHFFVARSYGEEWSAARHGAKRLVLAIGRRGARELVPLEEHGGGAYFYPRPKATPFGVHGDRLLLAGVSSPVNVFDQLEERSSGSLPRPQSGSDLPEKFPATSLPSRQVEPLESGERASTLRRSGDSSESARRPRPRKASDKHRKRNATTLPYTVL